MPHSDPWPDLGGAAAAGGSVVGGARAFWRRLKGRRQRDRNEKLFWDGDPGVPGVRPRVVPGAERVLTLEQSYATLSSEVREIKGTLTTMSSTLETVAAKVDGIPKNGGDTMGLGDMLYRVAKALGVDDPTKEPGQRRSTDH